MGSTNFKIMKLEAELERLKMQEYEYFPLSEEQLKSKNQKEKQFEENKKILNGFLYFLDKYMITLRLVGSAEGSKLFSIFLKEMNLITRTQAERNTLKEVMNRCASNHYKYL